MRVFVATLGTETNTFAPLPTGLAGFQGRGYDPSRVPTEKLDAFAMPTRVARERGTTVEALLAAETEQTLIRHLVTAEDIANVVAFLCSPLAIGITGDSAAASKARANSPCASGSPRIAWTP